MGFVLRRINDSYYAFKVAEKLSILYGLGAIKGVGEKAVTNIIRERDKNGPFGDLFDFCLRVDTQRCNKRACEALITAGAFDAFGEHRAALLHTLSSAISFAGQQEGDRSSGQDDMFGLNPPKNVDSINATVGLWSERQRLEHERNSLGLYLTGHPIQYHAAELEQIIDGKIESISSHPERMITIAGLVSGFRTYNTRRGENMAFVSLDDQTGRADISVFGELYGRARRLVQSESLLVVSGTCSKDERSGELQVRASSIDTIESLRQRALAKIVISIGSGDESRNALEILSGLLEGETSGNTEIVVCYLSPEGGRNLDVSWNRLESRALRSVH